MAQKIRDCVENQGLHIKSGINQKIRDCVENQGLRRKSGINWKKQGLRRKSWIASKILVLGATKIIFNFVQTHHYQSKNYALLVKDPPVEPVKTNQTEHISQAIRDQNSSGIFLLRDKNSSGIYLLRDKNSSGIYLLRDQNSSDIYLLRDQNSSDIYLLRDQNS